MLLALPQIALSLGNSVLATRQVVGDLFPARAPLTVRRIGTTYALMNLVAAPLGGLPVCHGSGGMVGHYAFGARSGGSVVLYGVFLLLAGFFLVGDPTSFQRLFPGPILGVLLLVEAVSVLLLVRDIVPQRWAFALALACGVTAAFAPYGYAVALVAGTVLWYLARRISLQQELLRETGPSCLAGIAGGRPARRRRRRFRSRRRWLAQSGPRFEIAFSAAAHPARITGRAYVALSRTSTADRGPIAQAGENGVPLFGVDIDDTGRGQDGRYRHRHLRASGAEPAQPAGRRVLGAAVRERVHEVRARRRDDHLGPHGPVGRAELAPLTGQPVRRAGEGPWIPDRTRRSASWPTR